MCIYKEIVIEMCMCKGIIIEMCISREYIYRLLELDMLCARELCGRNRCVYQSNGRYGG